MRVLKQVVIECETGGDTLHATVQYYDIHERAEGKCILFRIFGGNGDGSALVFCPFKEWERLKKDIDGAFSKI